MQLPFRDRRDAGRALAERLARYADQSDLLVLALPRGGVPVAWEVAQALQAPLDVFLVRKLGVPGHEELAMGAIASGGTRVLNPHVVRSLGIPTTAIDQVVAREEAELARRETVYRGSRPPPDVRGRTVILIDDGLATGATMRAALNALRQQGPRRLVVAVPVASAPACSELRDLADEVICLATPEPFYAVGQWYEDFTDPSEADIQRYLATASGAKAAPAPGVDDQQGTGL